MDDSGIPFCFMKLDCRGLDSRVFQESCVLCAKLTVLNA